MANDTAAASGSWPSNAGDFNAGTATSRQSPGKRAVCRNLVSYRTLDVVLGESIEKNAWSDVVEKRDRGTRRLMTQSEGGESIDPE